MSRRQPGERRPDEPDEADAPAGEARAGGEGLGEASALLERAGVRARLARVGAHGDILAVAADPADAARLARLVSELKRLTGARYVALELDRTAAGTA